jgi:DNA polymerase lambda
MRMKAKVMGYSLNQRGLAAGVVRDLHDWRIKTNPGAFHVATSLTHIHSHNITGQIIASETEDEIFRILEVPWQEPHERARG